MKLPDTVAASIAALNQRHNTLAARWASGPPPVAEVRALIADIIDAGQIVPASAERDALRNILYFWSSDLASRGERSADEPLPALKPFVERAPAEPPPAAMASAQPSPAPAPVAAAAAPAGPMQSLRNAIEAAGAKVLGHRHSAAMTAPAAPQAPSPASAPPSDVEARTMVRLAALARQWRTADDESKKGYLLTNDKTLAEASLFKERDPDIAALVEASEAQQIANKRTKWVAWSLFGMTVVGAIAGWASVAWINSYREGQLKDAQIALLADSDSRRAAEREQIRIQAQNAVEALSRDDLAPLKQLLEKLGGATDNDLRRLQLAQTTPLERAADATFAPPQRQGPPPAQPAAQPTATCSGYLWFGSNSDSRLQDGRDPSKLKNGETVLLDDRADIRLRAEWPPDTYVMPRQVGLVPAGAKVTLSSDPRSYRRTLGDQIWAQVTVPRTYCSTVFLQYAGPPEKRGAVLDTLRGIGVQAPPAERIASATGLAEVRYFSPEDKAVAEQVAAALSTYNGGYTLRVLYVSNVPVRPSPGTIEVWLDLSR